MRLKEIFMFTLVALVSSCSKGDDEIKLPSGKVEVAIGAVGGVKTRTAIDEDDGVDSMSVKWCVDDQIALWADGTSQHYNGEKFQLRYYNDAYNNAEFSANIDEMTDEEYTYSAFYPHPAAKINGKEVNYTIPTTQDGTYNGLYDFRVADPKSGRALNGDIINNDFALEFRSVMHILKITIPDGYSKTEVSKIAVIFSETVAGEAKLDMSDTSLAPEIEGVKIGATIKVSESSSVTSENCSMMTLDLSKNPLNAGDGKSAWLFINPTSGVEAMSLIAYDSDGNHIGTHNIIFDGGHDFAMGRITPVNFGAKFEHSVPSIMLKLSQAANNLGEPVNSIKITAPAGATFLGGKSTVTPTFKDGVYIAEYDIFNYNNFHDKDLSIVYDSTHATVSNTLSLVSDNYNNGAYAYTVPYLLEEDFSGVTEAKNNGDDGGVGDTDLNGKYNTNYQDLTDWGISGWRANRVGVGYTDNNKSMRICCRHEGGGGFLGSVIGDKGYRNYYGRAESAKFSAIKDDISVNVTVTYNYKVGRYAKKNDWGWKDDKSSSVNRFHGSTASESFQDTEKEFTKEWKEWYDPWWGKGRWETYTSTETVINLFSEYYEHISNDANHLKTWKEQIVQSHTGAQFAGNIDFSVPTGDGNSANFSITSANNATRAMWGVSTNSTAKNTAGANGNYWLYIDNVKVQIAQ